jgi:molybdopterin-guanine dinucleotide biosynthesis protein A
MPLLRAEALRELAAACRDAAVPPTGPLPGAFRKSALSVLERRLLEGKLTLAAALDELETATVELDPAQLVNVNAQEDLARLT